MSVSLHPFLSGHPFRMKHLEPALAYVASHAYVWLTTGGEINEWYRTEVSLSRMQPMPGQS
jgi:allantoinase